jgi:hypothetical protein
MSKFQLVLGWIATVGGIATLAYGVLLVTVMQESSIMLVKLIWLPFVVLWGLRQIRTYNYDKRLNNEHDK